MSGLFGAQQGPTRINGVQINQSNLGYPVIVVMGKGKVQQTILWFDGFTSRKISTSGGKGLGGKDGSQYVYSADVLAALCDGGAGGILGIGSVWSGQSWLNNTDTAETVTIGAGGVFHYLPANATSMTGDHGVSSTATVSASYTDLGAPAPTALTGTMPVPLQRVGYVPGQTLSAGTYSIGPDNTYYFSTGDNGTVVQLSYTFALGTIEHTQIALVPSGCNVPVSGSIPFSADLGVQYYSTGSDGSLNGTALQRVSGTPGTGQYNVDYGSYTVTGEPGSETVTVNRAASYTFASGDINQEVMLTYKLNNTSALPAGTQTSLAFELIPGTGADSPAAILLTNYQSAALGYPGIAKVLYTPMDLGYGAQIQQNTFEVITADAWGGGIVDCNPVQCILKVLSDPVWALGAGTVPFPLAAIDNGTGGTWGSGNAGNAGNGARAMINVPTRPIGPALPVVGQTATAWFAANGFFISPVMDRQDTAASQVGRWLEAGMCSAFMSEGLMKLVPYGDTSVAGNGATWTAPASFDAELDDTCFLVKSDNTDPVKISSSPWTEAFNKVQISWSNRQNQYAAEVTPEEDKSAVNRYGSRIEDPQSFDFITTLAAARFAGSMRVKRNVYTRNTFEFSLPYRFGHLEPMGIVSLTTSSAWQPWSSNTVQLVRQPARIVKIVDNPDGTLDVTCESYLFGAANASLNPKVTGQPTGPANQFADPGNTEALAFVATPRLTGYAQNQIWIGANGTDAHWGGCNVYASMDGTKYDMIGTVSVASRLGTLDATLPSGSDPDTANAFVIDLTLNSSPLESGTSADADQANTLCYVDGELLAYSTCAIVGKDQYSAGVYTRRGLFGSAITAHAAGAPFLRLDSSVLKYTFDPSWAGKTVYLKFQSFNTFGNSAQDISTLTALSFVPYTAAPGVVIGFGSGTIGTGFGHIPPPIHTPPPGGARY
jgi:Putative phage tail protein